MLILGSCLSFFFFFFQAEDGIRDYKVTGVQTCALPITPRRSGSPNRHWAGSCRSPRARRRAPRDSRYAPAPDRSPRGSDRKSVVEGKRVDLGGGRIIKKKKKKKTLMAGEADTRETKLE